MKEGLTMKHIGIVSVTGPGAALVFQGITEASIRENRHPMITMNHLSFSEYTKVIERQDWDALADCLLQSLAVLKKAGADFAKAPGI